MFKVQRSPNGCHVLPTHLLYDLHLRQGGDGTLGQSEHRRMHAETTREHQVQEKGIGESSF